MAPAQRLGGRPEETPAGPADPSDGTANLPTSARRSLRLVLLSDRADAVGLGTTLIVIAAVFSVLSPYFLRISNLSSIGVAISLTGIVAAVETIVLVSGSLDLSFTAVMALSAIVGGVAMQSGLSFWVALLLMFITGIAAGLLNSALVVGVGVNPLIATIGTQFVFRGIALIWTGGQTLLVTGNELSTLANGTILGIPIPVCAVVGVFAVVALAMKYTRFGSRVYAVGGSESAARLAGISIWRLRTLVFVYSSVAASAAGLLLLALSGSASPIAASGQELTILGAVILGGTSLAGGRGTVLGTALGVMLLGLIANGLDLLGVESFWQTLVEGIVLVTAITWDEVRRKAQER